MYRNDEYGEPAEPEYTDSEFLNDVYGHGPTFSAVFPLLQRI